MRRGFKADLQNVEAPHQGELLATMDELALYVARGTDPVTGEQLPLARMSDVVTVDVLPAAEDAVEDKIYVVKSDDTIHYFNGTVFKQIGAPSGGTGGSYDDTELRELIASKLNKTGGDSINWTGQDSYEIYAVTNNGKEAGLWTGDSSLDLWFDDKSFRITDEGFIMQEAGMPHKVTFAGGTTGQTLVFDESTYSWKPETIDIPEINYHIGYEAPENPSENDFWFDLNTGSDSREILADWKMNEIIGGKVIDYSGNGYSGTVNGALVAEPSINEKSLGSIKGNGTDAYVQTNFNTAGLNDFKVEVYCKRNNATTSSSNKFESIVSNYRRDTTPVNVGWYLAYDFTNNIIASRLYTQAGDTGTTFSSATVAFEVGKVYKIELEYNGSTAYFRVFEVTETGLLQKLSKSVALSGALNTTMFPLTMLRNNITSTGALEFSQFTLGRVLITKKEV